MNIVMDAHPLNWPEAFAISVLIVAVMGFFCFMIWVIFRSER